MLRYFDKVAQLGQFSRAAQQLNITRSPLSAQIKELEEVLGTALFGSWRFARSSHATLYWLS
ncbi:hypothetical protein NA76_23175, partial [Vibrio vulnificus]